MIHLMIRIFNSRIIFRSEPHRNFKEIFWVIFRALKDKPLVQSDSGQIEMKLLNFENHDFLMKI